MAEGYHRKGYLAVRMDIQQPVHVCVHESADHLGRYAKSCADGQQIGQESAVIPAKVTISTGLIFPRIAPVRAGRNDGERGMDNCCFTRRSLTQCAAIVSCS